MIPLAVVGTSSMRLSSFAIMFSFRHIHTYIHVCHDTSMKTSPEKGRKKKDSSTKRRHGESGR